MRLHHWFCILVITGFCAIGGVFVLAPYVLANLVSTNVMLGEQSMAGVPESALAGVVSQYEQVLLAQTVQLALRDKTISRTLGEVGVTLNQEATLGAIAEAKTSFLEQPTTITPIFTIDQTQVTSLAEAEFADFLTLPVNASLFISPAGVLTATPSAVGENIDLTTLAADMQWRARHNEWGEPIGLKVVSMPPSVHEGEVAAAQTQAAALLRDGLPLTDGVASWRIEPFTIRRLLRFEPQPDPVKSGNQILGVTADSAEVSSYLTTTIAPEVNRLAVDARFERTAERVTQFAFPQEGRALNVDASVAAITHAVTSRAPSATLVIDVTAPAIRDTSDIETFGIADLLAVGTSDFAGSPNNRRHNIAEGTTRYHGLLIPAGHEFSFNEFLGPVDGVHGFKPELVIKHNMTTPEFGGGLCQVSTTIFRAATYAGLKITDRRNHAYAVSYYGTPGFDATIYPPYTDLRFTNNTPGYILIQARIEGTKLTVEFWGTNDNREVVVSGPHPYDRIPNGAVKATLTQKVTRAGEIIIDETFYSRYRSPNLFPKPNATNPTPSPAPPPAGGPVPTPAPKPAKATPKPAPKPAT